MLRRGTASTLPSSCVALCIFYVVLCIVCLVAFPVLFVCICVLYYCHRMATQLQLNISYHIISLVLSRWIIKKYSNNKFRQNPSTRSRYVPYRTTDLTKLIVAIRKFAKTTINAFKPYNSYINPLNPELNPICYLLALLGAHHFLYVSRIRVKLLTLRRLMLYIYIWSTHS